MSKITLEIELDEFTPLVIMETFGPLVGTKPIRYMAKMINETDFIVKRDDGRYQLRRKSCHGSTFIGNMEHKAA